jgi:hypothetical protein
VAGARALLEWRRALVADLGGPAVLSAQQMALVEVTTRTRLYVDHLDAFLMHQKSLVNAKKKTALPVLLQRQQLADSLARYLTTLGLHRVATRAPTLQEYLASRNGQNAPPGDAARCTTDDASSDQQSELTRVNRPSCPQREMCGSDNSEPHGIGTGAPLLKRVSAIDVLVCVPLSRPAGHHQPASPALLIPPPENAFPSCCRGLGRRVRGLWECLSARGLTAIEWRTSISTGTRPRCWCSSGSWSREGCPW